jgi:hypothetical protein
MLLVAICLGASLTVPPSGVRGEDPQADGRRTHRTQRAVYRSPQIGSAPATDSAAQRAPQPPPPDFSDYVDPRVEQLVPAVVTVGYQSDDSAEQGETVLETAPRSTGSQSAGSQSTGSPPRAAPQGSPQEMMPAPQPPGETVHQDPVPFYQGSGHAVGCGCGQCAAAGDTISGCDARGVRYGLFGGLLDACGWGTAGCDSWACDAAGCDSCGPCGPLPIGAMLNDQWFGSAEWMLWVRRGSEFPVLAVDPTGDPDVTLFGGADRYGEEGVSGGRFTLGLWLDPRHRQSLVGRFWGAGRETYGANFASANFDAVSIPINDPVTGPDTFDIINNAPAGANEFLNIELESEAYGADVSLRQVLRRGLGGRIEFLYGYQFFRLNEELAMHSRAVLAPGAGNTTDLVTDQFDIANEFHGGQLGIHLDYREGRWMFDGLFKLGLGNVRRSANLSFRGTRTDNNNPANSTPIDAGYLVNDANAGGGSTDSFAVMPEIGLQLGYRLNRYTDFTIGYSYLAVTDVLQAANTVSTTVDTTFNLPNDPPAAPVRSFTHDDYWLHGLNLGVRFNY